MIELSKGNLLSFTVLSLSFLKVFKFKLFKI